MMKKTFYLAVDRLELVDVVWEGDDLGRTDEGEVQRIEKDDHIFAAVIL